MPIIKSAIKRARQEVKRKQRNLLTKRNIKEATKAFIAKPSADKLSLTQSEIDKAVKKGLIKRNTAARRKSQLSAIAKAAGVKLDTTKKVKTTTVKKAVKVAPKAAAKPVVKLATKKVTAKKPATKKPVAKKTTK